MSFLYNPGKAYKVTTGNYTGDNTANRVIPHGVGSTPKLIILGNDDAGPGFLIFGSLAAILNTTTPGLNAVTIPDVTNFYVGNAANYSLSANANASNYHWTAFE